MKKILKLLTSVSLTLALSLVLTGCNGNDKENDLSKIEDNVEEQFDEAYTYSEDKVNEAITYIHDNIDNIKDTEVAKKIYEYSTYIENVADKSSVEVESAITDYASKAKDYAHDVYTANEDQIDDIVEKGKEGIDSIKNTFESGKDTIVNEFHKLFK